MYFTVQTEISYGSMWVEAGMFPEILHGNLHCKISAKSVKRFMRYREKSVPDENLSNFNDI